jgi:hypothetical protein
VTGDKNINLSVADRLDEAAMLLENQQANPFRVKAYRNAARALRQVGNNLGDLYEREGVEGLETLPGIGRSLAAAIAEMIQTGHWSQLERLRGTAEPEKLFRSVPGIGPRLARRLHETLHADTLEALELAAHDGRVETVEGVGARGAAGLRAALDAMLRRAPPAIRQAGEEPGVDVILDVDAEYRMKAKAGRLSKIAPKRFNPGGAAWLPILHTERGPWQFTALFSNTARAHELGRIVDWVVVYFHTDAHPEGQRTIVTERQGELAGRRVVRGREIDCHRYYRTATGGAPPSAGEPISR